MALSNKRRCDALRRMRAESYAVVDSRQEK